MVFSTYVVGSNSVHFFNLPLRSIETVFLFIPSVRFSFTFIWSITLLLSKSLMSNVISALPFFADLIPNSIFSLSLSRSGKVRTDVK